MSGEAVPSYRQRCLDRIMGLRAERDSWEPEWRDLAEYIMPKRYRSLPMPGAKPVSRLNSRILDETGTIAAYNLRGGMMSGITSPTRPWFKLAISGFDAGAESQAVMIWVDEVVRRMMRVFHESNYYASMSAMYLDLAVFGTGAKLMYQDFENVINCQNPALGTYYVGNDAAGAPGVFARQFVMSAAQIKQRWPEGQYSSALKTALDRKGSSLSQEFVIFHLIEPNDGAHAKVPSRFKWRETYFLGDASGEDLLEVKGFFEQPFSVARWDTTDNDAYGRGPGHDALPAIRQLQQMTKRESQAIDKMVNPPLVASSILKNKPATSLPGGVTYVDGMSNENPGMRSLYQVNFSIQELMMTKSAVQGRIKEIFFNDLFLMISQLDTVRTATEIDARREEKLVMLGPVLERFEGEVLDPDINRTFNIMLRGGLLPEPPPELQRQYLHVDYVSQLAEAQRATATSGIERVWATAGNLAAVAPDVLDTLDMEEGLREYGSYLAVPPRIFRSPDDVAALRQQRASAQQSAQLQEQTVAGAQAAKTLSQADVGGGQNALAMMLGNGTVQ